jgi:hypothetical protein
MRHLEVIVIQLPRDRYTGDVMPELRRLRAREDVRLVDLLVVEKNLDGDINVVQGAHSEELPLAGQVAPLLAGLVHTNAEEGWSIAKQIPNGCSAAIGVVEHRWARAMCTAVERAGAEFLIDEVVHPAIYGHG